MSEFLKILIKFNNVSSCCSLHLFLLHRDWTNASQNPALHAELVTVSPMLISDADALYTPLNHGVGGPVIADCYDLDIFFVI